LIAAAISANGHARTLVLRGLRGEEAIAVSSFVLTECERNLARKAARALPAFAFFREMMEPVIVNPTRQQIEEAAEVVDPKDAPVVAGARAARAEWIISYDRRHLLSQRAQIFTRYGIQVGTPEAYLNR
jgi:predicted nucleic acid-binding protein